MFFSVVIPIYKVENYLERCVESVLTQSFGDFELILVDDGSPDKCPEICDKLRDTDSRIIVIHKENGGLVSARQAGIKIAKGEYILNLDADDAIESDTLETAYEIIKSTDTDVVAFSLKYFINGKVGDTVNDILDEGLYEGDDLVKKVYPKLLSDKNMKHIAYFLSGKIIRRTLVAPNQLNISTKISLGEDVMCVVPCFLQAEKIYISKKATYLYTIRDDSMSVSSFTHQMRQLNVIADNLKKLDLSGLADFEEQFSRYYSFMCFALLASAAQGNAFKIIPELKDIILKSAFVDELKKAEFEGISIKSRISLFLLKKRQIRFAFYFLYICKELKILLKKVAKKS